MHASHQLIVMLIALLHYSALTAQTTYQIAIDDANQSNSFVYNDAVVNDNGSVAILARSTQDSISTTITVVNMFDVEGDLLWSRSYEGTDTLGAQRIVSMTDGGVAVFAPIIGPFLQLGSAPYRLDRIDSIGNLLWSKQIGMNGIADRDYGYSSAHALPDGGLVLNLGLFSNPTFVRLDSTGNPVWARSYMTYDPSEPFPKTPTFDFGVTNNGGLIITEKAISDLMLTLVDPNGLVLWSKRYWIGNYTHPKTAVQLSSGDLLVAGYIDEYDHIPYAARLDSSGNVIWMRSYQGLAFHDGFQRILELDHGDLILSSRDVLFGETSSDLGLRISASGYPLERLFMDGTYSATNMEVVNIKGGQLTLAGQVDLDVGVGAGTQRYSQVWRTDTSVANVCGVSTSDGSLIPYVDLTTTLNTVGGLTTIDRQMDIIPLSVISTVQFTTPYVICSMVGISDPAPSAAINVRPTLVHAGEYIYVDLESANGILKVVSADGQLMHQTNTYSQSIIRINTTTWTLGCYLMSWHDRKGGSASYSKVLVH